MKDFLNKLIELSYESKWTTQEFSTITNRIENITHSKLDNFTEDLINEIKEDKKNKSFLIDNILHGLIHTISNNFPDNDIFYSVSANVKKTLDKMILKNNDNDFLDILKKRYGNISLKTEQSGFILFNDSLIRFTFYYGLYNKHDSHHIYITEFKLNHDKPYINLGYHVIDFKIENAISYNNGVYHDLKTFDLELFPEIKTKDYQLTPELNKEILEHFELFKKFFLFLEYAPIQNKESFIIIDKHSKVKLPKSKSKIKVPILNIDSTYYTNFRLNSKFNVNGHFRLQPYGKERQLKKIIWINEFKKSGYVRQAKILTSV